MDIDKDQLVELIPHYVAMVLLALLLVAVIRELAGGLSIWVEFILIVVIVFLYRPLVVELGIGPSGWE